MSIIKEYRAETLQQFLGIIDDFTFSPDDPLWFRGVGDVKYDLIPTLYRHSVKHGKEDLLDIERSMIIRFQERALPYLENPLSSEWECLFLMQHYGIPTRLLDWTENPTIALYFALTSLNKKSAKPVDGVAVWILSPRLWNKKVFSHVSYDSGALSVKDRVISPYEPLKDTKMLPSFPAAIQGIHNSRRIVAQRGVFTIFGGEIKSMQQIYKDFDGCDGALSKVLIPSMSIPSLQNKLLSTGHTEAMIFPGLDGLARETKRLFGYSE